MKSLERQKGSEQDGGGRLGPLHPRLASDLMLYNVLLNYNNNNNNVFHLYSALNINMFKGAFPDEHEHVVVPLLNYVI